MIPPLHCREINAEREKKALTLADLAALAKVNYYTACRVLRGREINPRVLRALRTAVEKARMPREAAAA